MFIFSSACDDKLFVSDWPVGAHKKRKKVSICNHAVCKRCKNDCKKKNKTEMEV